MVALLAVLLLLNFFDLTWFNAGMYNVSWLAVVVRNSFKQKADG